jgi:integrase
MIKSYIKDGKKFYEVFVLVRDPSGKQMAKRKRGLSSERIARDTEFELKTQLKRLATGETALTWQRWQEDCLRQMAFTRKKATIMNYQGRLSKWLPKEWMERELDCFTRAHVHELIHETIGSKTSPHSLKIILKMVKRVFEMAVEDGKIPNNPALGILVKAPQREQKVLNAKEASRFLEIAKDTDHRFYHVWAFALLTGMRSGEMYALRWSDIDLESGNISVNKQWTNKDGFGPTKTGDTRVVPIGKDLRRLILELRSAQRSDTDFVLPHPREWTNGEQAQVTREFCASIGVTSVKFHDLRATFITNLLAQRVSLPKVMAIVGHRKMATTDVYLRLAGVEISGATDALGYSLPDEAVKGEVIQFRRPEAT